MSIAGIETNGLLVTNDQKLYQYGPDRSDMPKVIGKKTSYFFVFQSFLNFSLDDSSKPFGEELKGSLILSTDSFSPEIMKR